MREIATERVLDPQPTAPPADTDLCVALRLNSYFLTAISKCDKHTHMAMALRILLLVPLPGITATDPCVLHGEADRDPHLHFAHGGRADFRGEEGQLYSFLSAPGLAVNVKTENAVFG